MWSSTREEMTTFIILHLLEEEKEKWHTDWVAGARGLAAVEEAGEEDEEENESSRSRYQPSGQSTHKQANKQ